jgi:hypothetical protein
MPEEHVDVMEQMQKMGEKFTEFRKTFVAHLKDYDVTVKEWTFTVGKNEKEYVVDFGAKLGITSKKKQ